MSTSKYYKSVIDSSQFGTMIVNSLLTNNVTTVISVGIPSISHDMGLVLLFGDNGLITNWTCIVK